MDALFMKRQCIIRDLGTLNGCLTIHKEIRELREQIQRIQVVVLGNEGMVKQEEGVSDKERDLEQQISQLQSEQVQINNAIQLYIVPSAAVSVDRTKFNFGKFLRILLQLLLLIIFFCMLAALIYLVLDKF